MIVNREPLRDWSEKIDKLDLKKLTEQEKLDLIIEALLALKCSQGEIGLN